MDATEWEKMQIAKMLPYPVPTAEWCDAARQALSLWLAQPVDVEIVRVRQLVTRHYPRYADYDLSAWLRAFGLPTRLDSGCQGDIVVDGSFGMHVSNAGRLYDRMWYGRRVAVVTVRCHEGHAEHFASWQVPYEAVAVMNSIRERVFWSLGGGYRESELRLQHAFEHFASRLEA